MSILIKLSLFGLTALILTIPLIVTHQTMYPFIFGKIIVFRILVEFILIILLVAWIRGVRWMRIQWQHPLILTTVFFFAVQVFTSLLGSDFLRSFWSTQERMTGLFTVGHFLIWFLIMTIIFRTIRQWKCLIVISLCVSLVMATNGFIEMQSGGMRSLLGNPIYISVYAMIHVYLSALLITLSRRQVGFLFIGAIGAVVNFIIMLLAGGRGVMLAFFISIGLLAFCSMIFLSRKGKIIITSSFMLLGLIVAGILWYGTTPQGTAWAEASLPYSIRRIVLLPQYWNPENRTEVWRIGIEGFKEKPLLGWGWENFSYIYQKYYTKIIPGEGTTYFDRSHNQLIDILSLNGIVGLGAYLALWVALYWMILRAMKRSTSLRRRSALLLLTGLFTAYFLQNLTVFDTPAPLIMFYFTLAFAYFICNEEELSDEGMHNKKPTLKALHAVPLCFAIGAIALYVMYELNIKPFIASAETVRAIKYMQQGNLEKSIDHFKRALSSNAFTNYENRIQLAKYTLTALQQGSGTAEEKKTVIQFALSEMLKNIDEHSLDVKSHYALAALYRLGDDYDLASLDKAESILTKAAEIAPMRPETFTEFLQFYVQKKDVQKSILWAEKVSQYVGKGEAHYQLGQLYLRRKEYPAMLAEMQAALREGYNIYENTSVYPYLAKTIQTADITPDIIAFIDAAALANPKNPDFLSSQIVVHYRAGDTEGAKSYLEELRAKNAAFAKAIEDYLKKE